MTERPLPGLPREAKAAFDPARDVLRLYGIQYSLTLFQQLGAGGLAIGTRVEIVNRGDGAVQLRTLPPELPPDYSLLEDGAGRFLLYREEWEEALAFPSRAEGAAYAWLDARLDARPDGSAAAPSAG